MTAETELFTCPKHVGNLRLTPGACAGMWRRGRRAGQYDLARICRGCPIGAGHAGIDPANIEAEVLADQVATATSCIRCGRPAKRLIGLTICVSCSNRSLEWLKGENRRGTFPHTFGSLSLFKAALTINGTRGELSALTGSLWEFIAVIFRHFPTVQGVDWPAITVAQSAPLVRTAWRELPRPYFPYFSKQTSQGDRRE
jgi:hypothetical protein